MTEIDTASLRARAIQQEWYEYESTVELCDALDAAEARIAASLELCEQDWDGFAWWDVAASIKSALTGKRRSIDDATPGEWDAANRRVTGAHGTNGCES